MSLPEFLNIVNILKLSELLLDLFQNLLIPQRHYRHPGISRICRDTYGKTFNIISAAAEKSRYSAQNTGGVIY